MYVTGSQKWSAAARLLVATLLSSAFAWTVSAQDSGSFLDTRNDPQLGQVLTDASGRTVYFSTNDGACESVCTGPCEKQWPPLLLGEQSPAAIDGIAGEFSSVARGDGTRQLCYNGRPLYRSHLDKTSGDSRGHGLGNSWYAANIQPTVQVLYGTANEPHLAGPSGMTLYMMVSDKPRAGKCRRGCAVNWPPLIIGHESVLPADPGSKLGTLRRSPPDRRLQVTYEGKPLYYWSRDRVPGDTTGDGIGDLWSIARPVSGAR